MTVSILVVDDESDVAELFRQRFRREVRQGIYAMHFATSGAEALARKVRKARVVAAFGTVPSEVLFGVFETRRKAGRPSMV